MRSNVRKMWTALLAVLFAAAVGFGLWFAFAPAARPANVHAAEETTVEIKKTENASTLYSNQPVEQLLGQFISGTVTLAGASTPSDLLSFAATGGVSYRVYAQYDAEQDQLSEERNDLRPDSDETAESYSRWVVAIAEVDGVPIESNPLELTVTKATISSLTAWFSGNNTFSALTAIPQDAPLTVQVMYFPGAGQPFSPDRGSEYGTYQIIYNQEGEYTDRLEYRDTSITIKYTEGNVSKSVPVAVNVSEAYVETPRWKDYNVVPELSYTGEERTVELEKYDSTSLTNDANVESEDGILSLTGTDADEYSVTISVKEGYKFREDFPQYATATYKDGKIVALKYTWKITKASINSVTVTGDWKDGWTFGTPDAAPSRENVALNILYEGSSVTVTKSPDDVDAKVTFYFREKGTQASYSTDFPTDAGEYEWYVTLTEMTNYEAFTGSGENGGSGSFTIQKKPLTVPSLASNKLPYNGSAQSAATSTSTLYSFSSDSGTNVTAEGYEATFTLTDPDNYKWADGAAVSGNKGEIATVTWHIVQAENTISDFKLDKDSWTWSETAQPSPSATAKFGGEITYKYYSDKALQNEITSPTAWNVGTYYVTATSSADTSEYENYTSVTTEAISFTVSRAGIDFPTLKKNSFVYNGQLQTPELSATPVGFTAELTGQTNANTYTVTATLDENHQWNTANASGSYVYDYELEWTISPYQIGVEGALSITGWTYGGTANEPSGVSLNDETSALLGTATATFKYEYLSSAEGSAYTETVPTDAGDYTVRLTISVNSNFKNYTKTANFTIKKKTVNVNWSETPLFYNGTVQTPTAETDDFLNGDDTKLIVSGGQKDAGTNYTATASLSGKDAKNYVLADTKPKPFTIAKKSIGIEWGTLEFIYNGQPQQPTAEPTGVVDGDDLTLTVTVSGEHKDAGTNYTATAKLEGKDAWNYQLPDKDTTQFTIHKKQISIPELLGDENTPSQREFEHDGNAKFPTINGDWGGATVTQSGYFKSDFKALESAPVEFGDYFVRLTLSDTQNYKWVTIASDQLPQTGEVKHIDTISGKNNEYLYVAFRITGSLYSISVSHEGWRIGNDRVPIPSVTAAKGSEDALNSALDLGVTVTFTYYFVENGTETEVATVTANNGTTTLGFVPVEVALKAGTYKVRVDISASDNQSYAARTALSATFTVSPYELQEGDVKWTVPSDPIYYKGTKYTFGGEDPNIYATYKTWSYANGVYSATENGGYLTLALTGEAEEILNAGDYFLTAELPQGETNVVWGDNASKTHTVTIEKRVVDVTLKEYTVIYKGAAFEAVGAVIKTHYTASAASGDTGLLEGDELGITLTPRSDAINVGSYAWGEIKWSNQNYSVNVTNEKEEVFTIDPAEITVTIKPQSYKYGQFRQTDEQVQSLYTVNGLYGSDSVTVKLSYSKDGAPVTLPKNVGTYTVSASISGNPNYVLAETDVQEGTLTITKKTLTIKGPTSTIEYGEAAPKWDVAKDVAYDELGFAEDKELLDKLITLGTGYEAGDGVKSYPITVTVGAGDILNNYTVQPENGSLNVTPREITVTIQDVTTTYGTAGELTATASREDGKQAILDGDTPYTLALDGATLSDDLDAGEYIIFGTATNDNYSITFAGSQDYGDGKGNAGSYKVDPQSLTITYQFKHLEEPFDSGKELVYDGAAWEVVVYAADVDETITFKVTYQVMGENGEYTDLGSQEVPTNAGNYKFNVAAGQVSGNYQANNGLSASFIIKQREVSVTWTESTFTYDGTDQKEKVTAGYRAYRKGEQDDTLTPLNVSISSGQLEFKDAGSYTFEAVLIDQNYKLKGASEGGSVSKKYQMEKAEITISVSSPTFTYGKFDGKYSAGKGTETDQLTYKVNGLFGSDTVQVTLSYSRDGVPVTLPENVADYTVSASIAEHQNYTLGTVTSGTLKIEKKALTVTVDGTSIEYGEAAPSVYNVTLEGALSDEGAAIKKLLQFDTLEYSVGKDVGNYTVKASFGADENGILKNYEYTVTDDGVVATCTLKVTPRKITVEIKDVETAYGTAGTLTAHVTREDGTTNNAILDRDLVKDGGQVVSGIAQFANVFTLSLDNATLDRLLNVGDYTIVGAAVTTGDGAKGGNYEITFVGSQNYDGKEENAGLYTVDPLEVEVNFEVVSREGSENLVYDGTAWKFTATAEGVIGADGQRETVSFQVTYSASEGSQLTGDFAVSAGSYTVSVKPTDGQLLSENGNYIAKPNEGETVCSHEFEIKKQVLDISWRFANWQDTDDGAMEEERGVNYIVGYNPDIMSYGTHSSELTIVNDGTNGQPFKVSFAPSGQTTYRIEIELTDYDNYCWRTPASNVSGDHDEIIQIGFTVGATTNNITFTEIANGVYGETYVVQIATSAGDTAAEGTNVLIFADSVLHAGADESSLIINYAKHVDGVTDGGDERLKFTLSSLDGMDAGDYWIRVRALGAGVYGYGVGYCKVTIGKKTITKDEIDNIKFTTEFVYNGKEQKPVAIDLPEYLKVTFSEGATNVTDGMELRATFTIVGDNCEFKGGAVSLTRDITIKITPYVITEIYWDENPSFIYNGTDQSKDVLVYFVDVNDGRAKLTATTKTEGGFLNAGDYTFTAQVPAGGNYKFQDDLTITNTITMAKASVSVVILDQSGEYSGKGFELQTRYNIDGRHSYDTALNTALYKELAEKLELVIQDGAAINAGTYTITLKDGYRDLQNYEVTLQTGTLTITPKQLTFTWPTVTGGVYQGENPGVTLTGNEFEGFVDGEGYGNIESLIKIVYSGTTNEGVKYSDSKVPTEAGSYTVTVTLGEGNYTLNAGAQAYLVARADYSFTVAINGWTYNAYDATANAPSVNGEHPENLSVTYTYAEVLRSGVYGDFTDTVPTNAGSYVVRAQYAQGNNYNEAVAETLFTIEKAAITVKITFKQQVEGVSGWVNGWVYGTAPKDIYELGESSNPGKGDVTATYSTGSWSGSAIPTEVGEYTLTVTVAETNNYESGSASVEFKIVQASEEQLSFTVSIDGWTYGEEPHAPSVIWGGGLTGHPDQISPVYTYAKAKADGETYSDKDFSSTVPTNAGSYVVKATFAETDHYGELSAMCKFVIGKAAASIDTSGMQKNFTYNGRAQAVGGAVLNHSETTLVYSPDTVTAVGTYTVAISAAETANYSRVSVTVTVTVSRASAGFSVRIDDWTYGETPSRYTISGGSGGSVTVTYSGTTNAGVKYSSSKVPTEAGEYTITVVMSASGNFLGGTARDSFTIHRAKAEAELSLAGWAYGETPNSYLLTPEFLREEVIRAVYSDGTYYSEAVPQDVGSYTLTVTYGETDNYLGGEVSCKFSITRYDLGLSVSIEGWTYGDEPNKPVVTGADIVGLTLSYTGTANDGTMWSSNTAPEKAGSYTLTVTVTKAGSYTDESASVSFTIARRLLTLPAWNEEGVRDLTEVYGGERMMRSILGFDMALMNVQSETAQFMFNGSGASVMAYEEGTYLVQITLKDTANYGWAQSPERGGEGTVTLTWKLAEEELSLLWLIILLAVLVVIALIVLIVLLKKGGKPDGTDTGKSDVRLSSVAPVGLLLVVAPLGEIIAVVVLGVVLAAVVIADIAVGVRNAKRAKAAENAQEPVPAYGDEAAAEGEAYLGTEAPADDGAEDVPDEGEAYFGTEVPADDGAEVASDEGGMLQ